MKGWLLLLVLLLTYSDSSFICIALSSSRVCAACRQRRSSFPPIQKALHPLGHYPGRQNKHFLDYNPLYRTNELFNARDIGERSQSETKSPVDFGDSLLVSLSSPFSNILRQHDISMTTAMDETVSMGYRLYSKIATSSQIDDIHMHDLLQFVTSCRQIPFFKIYLNPWIITLRHDLNAIHSKKRMLLSIEMILKVLQQSDAFRTTFGWHNVLFPRQRAKYETDGDVVIHSDASSTFGMGAVDGRNGRYYSLKYSEIKMSGIRDGTDSMDITFQELWAIVIAAQLWGKEWSGKVVFFLVDNFGVSSILSKKESSSLYSHRNDLLTLLHILCGLAQKHGFHFWSKWIPRDENREADRLSKGLTITHWKHGNDMMMMDDSTRAIQEAQSLTFRLLRTDI